VRLRPRTRPDAGELRELHASAQLLERLALERSGPFDAAALAELRAANARLGEVAAHPAKALIADHQVRGLLTEPCRDGRVLALLAEIRFALLPHRRPAMESPLRVIRRADEHAAVIEALARGERGCAARLLQRSAAAELEVLVELVEPAPSRARALSS
jgi:DNA-binding GntR family transcriptional regulator